MTDIKINGTHVYYTELLSHYLNIKEVLSCELNADPPEIFYINRDMRSTMKATLSNTQLQVQE